MLGRFGQIFIYPNAHHCHDQYLMESEHESMEFLRVWAICEVVQQKYERHSLENVEDVLLGVAESQQEDERGLI